MKKVYINKMLIILLQINARDIYNLKRINFIKLKREIKPIQILTFNYMIIIVCSIWFEHYNYNIFTEII